MCSCLCIFVCVRACACVCDLTFFTTGGVIQQLCVCVLWFVCLCEDLVGYRSGA